MTALMEVLMVDLVVVDLLYPWTTEALRLI